MGLTRRKEPDGGSLGIGLLPASGKQQKQGSNQQC